MLEERSDFGSVETDQRTVVISQDCPMIQSQKQHSVVHRAGKLLQRVRQNEWISQFDLFSIPLKLNYRGQDTFKTEFGGVIYILVAIACIVLTVIFKFPNGLQLQDPITFHSILKPGGETQSVFDHSKTFFKLYFQDKTTGNKISTGLSDFLIRQVRVYQNTNGVGRRLEVKKQSDDVTYSFESSDVNQKANMFDSADGSFGKLNLQVKMCSSMQNHATHGRCFLKLATNLLVLEVTYFTENTGKIVPNVKKMIVAPNIKGTLLYDRKEFTTNSKTLGHIANLMAYQLNYYQPSSEVTANTFANFATDYDCAPTVTTPLKPGCTIISFSVSGLTHVIKQQFQDITLPVLFFLSLSQTLLFIIYILFLKNYANNCMYLSLADSLVYLPNKGKHHDFKRGVSVFLACLIHQHPLVMAIDHLLYTLCQTQIKRCLPLKAQLTMDMIDYGQKCLDQKNFFDPINHVYQHQNLQPSKIIVDFQKQQQQQKIKEQQQQDPGENYFQDEVQEQAFKQMCQQHGFYSYRRKKHLAFVLKQTHKNHKLTLKTQKMFAYYKRIVNAQRMEKEIQIPVEYMAQELSGHQIKKELDKISEQA